VYQHQLSMPSLRGRLMSTSESWGVNGHTTRCTGPAAYPWSCGFGWCKAEGYRKRRSAPPHGLSACMRHASQSVRPIPASSIGQIHIFLPARRYASAGLCDSNVSVRLSVRHTPVLCQNEES